MFGVRFFLIGVLGTGVACSGGGGADKPGKSSQQLCVKLEECNQLNGSLRECNETFALERNTLTPTEQRDFDKILGDCLEFSSCDAVTSCLSSLPGAAPACADTCEYALDGECDDVTAPGAITNLCGPGTDCSDCF